MEASHRLPAEVQYRILDQLSDDPSALLRSSLVSLRWLNQSRRVYWSIYPLRFGTQRSTRANDFILDLLTRDACKFLPYVQNIELQGHHRNGLTADRIHSFVSCVASSVTPSTLSLIDIILEDLLPETIDILMTFKDLRSLTCKSLKFMGVDLFCKFFSAFHRLQTCDFGVYTHDKIDHDHKEPLVEPGFNSLESFSTTIYRSTRLMIPAIVQSQCKLQKLSLSWMAYSGYDLVSDLLSLAGEHLRELSLRIAHFASQVERRNGAGAQLGLPLTLSSNTSLQMLEISEIRIEPDQPYPTAWLKTLLGSIASPLLQRLRLKFSAHDYDATEYYPGNFDWSVIETAIPVDTGFASRGIIQLGAEQPEWHLLDEKKLSEDFRSRLPDFDRADRLEVGVVAHPLAQGGGSQ